MRVTVWDREHGINIILNDVVLINSVYQKKSNGKMTRFNCFTFADGSKETVLPGEWDIECVEPEA